MGDLKANIKKEDFYDKVGAIVKLWEYNCNYFQPEVSRRANKICKRKLKEWKNVQEQLKYGNALLTHRQLKELEDYVYL